MAIGRNGQADQRLALARTIYGEARGEGVAGMEAVAQVIMNRLHAEKWYSGSNIQAVVFKKWQFSAWNVNDPNRDKIMLLMPNTGDVVFDMAYSIAGKALAGDLENTVGDSTHYHAAYILPNWAEKETPDYKVGNHLFYEGIA